MSTPYLPDDASCYLRCGYIVRCPQRGLRGRVVESGSLSAIVRLAGGERIEVDQFSHGLSVERRNWREPAPIMPRNRWIRCMDGSKRLWRSLAIEQYKRLASAFTGGWQT